MPAPQHFVIVCVIHKRTSISIFNHFSGTNYGTAAATSSSSGTCFSSCTGGEQLFLYLDMKELSECSLATKCLISLKTHMLRMENEPKLCQGVFSRIEKLEKTGECVFLSSLTPE